MDTYKAMKDLVAADLGSIGAHVEPGDLTAYFEEIEGEFHVLIDALIMAYCDHVGLTHPRNNSDGLPFNALMALEYVKRSARETVDYTDCRGKGSILKGLRDAIGVVSDLIPRYWH